MVRLVNRRFEAHILTILAPGSLIIPQNGLYHTIMLLSRRNSPVNGPILLLSTNATFPYYGNVALVV